MNKNNKFLKILGVSLLTATTFVVNAETSANLSLVSDYVFRGISQSLEDPAIQGGFDWSHESGFYLGTWASSVDFSPSGTIDDGADLEWDLYLGYSGNVSDDWSYDISYVQYIYPGTLSGVDLDYGEIVLGLGFKELVNFTLGYSSDVFNSSETGIYYELSSTNDIGSEGWSWNASVGYYDLDKLNSSYSHYSVGLDKKFEKISMGLSFHDSNGEAEFGDIAGSRVVFSISTEF